MFSVGRNVDWQRPTKLATSTHMLGIDAKCEVKNGTVERIRVFVAKMTRMSDPLTLKTFRLSSNMQGENEQTLKKKTKQHHLLPRNTYAHVSTRGIVSHYVPQRKVTLITVGFVFAAALEIAVAVTERPKLVARVPSSTNIGAIVHRPE